MSGTDTTRSPSKPQSGQVPYQLSVDELYGFGKSEVPKELAYETVHWTNHAFVFVLGPDVVIDFIQAPGLLSEGKQTLPTVRVTMSRVVAQRLATLIQQNIEQAKQQALAAKQKVPGSKPTTYQSTPASETSNSQAGVG
jgi:hypothetical protein